MKKGILKIFCFMSLLGTIMYCFVDIFSFKNVDGMLGLKTFYEQNENINDVIFVGSSHIFEDVNTQVLWDEYGIASYDLAASQQPVWNSYYYIREAFKTQSPRLIVLDLLGVTRDEEYRDESVIIKNILGMKLSPEKIEAVKVSSQKEEWSTYLLGIPTYHTRYRELSQADFLPHRGIPNWEAWKGFAINPQTFANERPEGFQTDDIVELTDKNEQYLRKICEFCNQQDTALLFIKSPFITDVDSTARFNRAAEIGAEYGVSCVDFNYYYDEIGLDFSTDMGDVSHLNYRGNVKFSRYLAEYLQKYYDIPDRRDAKGYESYDVISLDCVMRTKNAAICDTLDLETFLRESQNEYYTVIYSVCGDYRDASNYEAVSAELKKYGINMDNVEGANVWVVQNHEIISASNNQRSYIWHRELAPYKNIEIRLDAGQFPTIIFNRESLGKVDSGINIVIYDSVTETIVDTAGFPVKDGKIQDCKIL